MTSIGTVISFPTPLYQNFPIQAQFYQPSRFVISSITLGQTTIITATQNMNFVIGQEVRLIIPPQFGSYQLNEQTGFVLSLPALNQVEINIDSSMNVDPYIAATSSIQAQILPVGDVNTGIQNANGSQNVSTFIPGSFQDISPV
jgi:hypothetical protein